MYFKGCFVAGEKKKVINTFLIPVFVDEIDAKLLLCSMTIIDPYLVVNIRFHGDRCEATSPWPLNTKNSWEIKTLQHRLPWKMKGAVPDLKVR